MSVCYSLVLPMVREARGDATSESGLLAWTSCRRSAIFLHYATISASTSFEILAVGPEPGAARCTSSPTTSGGTTVRMQTRSTNSSAAAAALQRAAAARIRALWSSSWASEPLAGRATEARRPTLLRRLREAELRRSSAHALCAPGLHRRPAGRRDSPCVVLAAPLAPHRSRCGKAQQLRPRLHRPVERGRYVLVGAFDGEKPKALEDVAGALRSSGASAGVRRQERRQRHGGAVRRVPPGARELEKASATVQMRGGDDWGEHEENGTRVVREREPELDGRGIRAGAHRRATRRSTFCG